MALIVPKIIGWPGAVLDPVTDNAPAGTTMHDHLIRTLNLAYMRPCIIKGSAGSEIWNAVLSMPLYSEYLKEGAGIEKIDTFSKNPNGITVAFQHMSPISESYSNDFSQNSILSGIGGGQENISDLGMMMGPSGAYDALEKKAKDTAFQSVFDIIDGLSEGTANAVGSIGGEGAKRVVNDIVNMAKKFDHKIDFPMMWRGSSFSTSYSLMIRLYNPIAANDDYYERLIVAPLIALLAFVCPKSDDGKTWSYPFIMKFDIPGRASLKAAYCSNISVVKGGDVNDVAYNSRPNMIDINMTINPVHSVKLLSKTPITSDAPSLQNEVDDALKTIIKKPPIGDENGTDGDQEEPSTINSAPVTPPATAPQFTFEQYIAAPVLSSQIQYKPKTPGTAIITK
jgi:hypothetical protein